MANITFLSASRNAVLRDAGWDVESDGLPGAPPITVLIGAEAHATIPVALRYLGLGGRRVIRVAADDQGRMRPDALAAALAGVSGPTIVCAQAGNVNSGAFDPLDEIAAITRPRGAWLHVDGAFGLWAAASPAYRAHVRGVELAQSWATDAHKWLNVPYDAGLAFVADTAAHRAAMSYNAAYLVRNREDVVHGGDWVPESSRRARGFTIYAALRSLGRRGLADLVDRSCVLARRMAERLAAGGATIRNDVVLNQVLVTFERDGADDAANDELGREIVAAVQRDGTCWLGGTEWHGRFAIRISVSGWPTTEEDIDRSADAILRCARETGATLG
jgi:glutamate/tyrosine decarboxylase-like PLP-dependent enzyme